MGKGRRLQIGSQNGDIIILNDSMLKIKYVDSNETTSETGSMKCGITTSNKVILYGITQNFQGGIALYRNDSYATIYVPVNEGLKIVPNTQIRLRTYYLEL